MAYSRTKRQRYQKKYGQAARSYSRNRGVYAPRKPRFNLSQGGVLGGSVKMSPPTKEVKFYDSVLVAAPATANWVILNDAILFGITQGAGQSQRIGRKIRVHGIVIRADVNTDTGSAGNPSPFQFNLVWDNQCNGGTTTINEIYAGTLGRSLPNPLFDSRFQFQAKIAVNQPQSALNIIERSIQCDKTITFDSSVGAISDLTTSNLITTFTSPNDATPNISGIIRVLYTDA